MHVLYTLARNTLRDPTMKLLLLTALQISVSCFERVVLNFKFEMVLFLFEIIIVLPLETTLSL